MIHCIHAELVDTPDVPNKMYGDYFQSVAVAAIARKVISERHAAAIASGAEFDVGFACGLSFALGAFSGVCEDESTKKGASNV